MAESAISTQCSLLTSSPAAAHARALQQCHQTTAAQPAQLAGQRSELAASQPAPAVPSSVHHAADLAGLPLLPLQDSLLLHKACFAGSPCVAPFHTRDLHRAQPWEAAYCGVTGIQGPVPSCRITVTHSQLAGKRILALAHSVLLTLGRRDRMTSGSTSAYALPLLDKLLSPPISAFWL